MRNDRYQMVQAGRMDAIAALLSNLCIVHCLILPLIFVILPIGALMGSDLVPLSSVHGPSWLHWLLIAIALPASWLALRRGYQGHRDIRPAIIAISGFLLVAAGALAHAMADQGISGGHDHGLFAELLEPGLTLLGGLSIGWAHWLNWVRMRQAA